MNEPIKLGLIGHNITYSLSPKIFETIFKLHKLTGVFDIYSVAEERLPDLVDEIKSTLAGFSVTIPYKKTIIQYLDDLDPGAEKIGAVNCVKNDHGRLVGLNTDYDGFIKPIDKYQDLLNGGKALIIGNGGAASAVIHALYDNYSVDTFYINGRSNKKVEEFIESISIKNSRMKLLPLNNKIENSKNIRVAIIINCTPIGGWSSKTSLPLAEDYDWTRADIYYDLNYNMDNLSVRLAHERGLIAIDGTTMLVEQARRAFKIWTGQVVSFDDIYPEVFGGK